MPCAFLPASFLFYSLDYLGRQLLNQHFLVYVFYLPAQVSPVSHMTSTTLVGFLRFFNSPLPSPVLSLVSRPWALVLSMMRWSRWGVRSCGCDCCLLVGVARLLASSDSPLLPLSKFPVSLSTPVLSPVPVLAPAPVLAPIPSLVLVLPPVSAPVPVPVPVAVSSLPPLVPFPPLGTTSSGRRRVLCLKLLATCKRHLLCTEMMLRTEWQSWSSHLLLP